MRNLLFSDDDHECVNCNNIECECGQPEDYCESCEECQYGEDYDYGNEETDLD